MVSTVRILLLRESIWKFCSALYNKNCGNGVFGKVRVLECELKLNSILWLFDC